MVSIKMVLRKKQLKDGKYPVCLRITKNRRTKYFKTIYNAAEKEWDDRIGAFNRNHSNYIQNNRLLLKFKDRALKIISELELENDVFSLDDFERRFRYESNPVQQNVFTFWQEIMDEMIIAGRTGNARVNHEAFNSLKRFHRNSNLYFEKIAPAFLNKYESHMRSRGGTDGGIGVRMRAIRALFNRAIERNLVKEKYYPFKAYKISKLKGKGLKKAITLAQVLKIVNVDLSESPHLINSKNYFVFSFYTRGMNFADMMKLEWQDIDEDRIYYTRSKTKGNFIVKILPPVKNILNYYQNNSRGTKYVFPILLHDVLTPTQMENRKKKTLGRYNRDLKEIAKLCDIDKPLSSYVARHSFANCLKQKGVSTDIISESLGHQNIAITQAYLKELDHSVIDQAMEILL